MAKALSGFKKGQIAWIAVHGAGVTSHEEVVTGSVRRGQIWLDNGRGSRPSGPYDAETLKYLGATICGFSLELLQEKPKGFKKH